MDLYPVFVQWRRRPPEFSEIDSIWSTDDLARTRAARVRSIWADSESKERPIVTVLDPYRLDSEGD